MAILGLMSTTELGNRRSENARRRVFYQYPQGRAPLMGLLSLTDTEFTDKTNPGWWEQRVLPKYTQTIAANAAGPFTNNAAADKADPWTEAAGTVIRIYLTDSSIYRERDVVQVFNAVDNAGARHPVQIIVDSSVQAAKDYIEGRLVAAVASVDNTATNVGTFVMLVGTAAGEGVRSRSGGQEWPVEIYNQTQIFRTVVGPFTRSALKQGLRFDGTGTYKTAAKHAALRHMEALEQAAFWSDLGTQNIANDDGDTVPERSMGGIYYYLKQWELGTAGNWDYRNGGGDISGNAWATEYDKRIIEANGTMTKTQIEDLVERAFFRTGETSFEKLVIGGSGAMTVFNRFIESQSVRNTKLNVTETYGMNVARWETTHGDLLFKSHPLFNENATLRNSFFILDVGSIDYIALNDSDTDLLKMRQARDFDGRKDEWLTECTLQVRNPERNMFVHNLTGITT